MKAAFTPDEYDMHGERLARLHIGACWLHRLFFKAYYKHANHPVLHASSRAVHYHLFCLRHRLDNLAAQEHPEEAFELSRFPKTPSPHSHAPLFFAYRLLGCTAHQAISLDRAIYFRDKGLKSWPLTTQELNAAIAAYRYIASEIGAIIYLVKHGAPLASAAEPLIPPGQKVFRVLVELEKERGGV